MIYKINRRTKTFRRIAKAIGWRLHVIVLPDPTYGLSDMDCGRPDDSLIGAMSPLYVGTLIYDDPANVQECAECGMDASMQHDLELCSTCHKCVKWEDEYGIGTCCTCGRFLSAPTDLDPQVLAMGVAY